MPSKKLIFVASLATLALAGCETSDDRTLAQGQACLDSATSSSALQCKDLVAGLSSQESNMIRCSADFIAQGFTGTRIADSISQIKNSSGSTDGTTAMIAYLVFKSTSPSADTAVSDCTAAGSRSMLRLATATKLATTIASAAGILGSIDPTSATAASQMQAAVNSLASGSPSASDLTTLGNTAILANSAYCSDGSSYVGTDVCNDLKTALASSNDPQAIAQALLQVMKK